VIVYKQRFTDVKVRSEISILLIYLSLENLTLQNYCKMKKIISITSILILLSVLTVNSQDLTLDEVLQNYYEVNNIEKISRVESVHAEGIFISQGMEMAFVQKVKRGDKVKIEVLVQNNKMIQAYNGESGWMVAPWLGTDEPQDMSDDQLDQLKEMADIDGILWNWEEKADTLVYIGKEDLEGTEVYVLKLTEKNDEEEIEAEGDEEMKRNTRFIYIDAENFVILKMKMKRFIQGNEMEIETYSSNFKEVDEVIMPFNMETKINGNIANQIIIEQIKFGEEIDDSEFEKPESEDE
jgi:outer membrane lipoprotein-sorting protein